MTANLILVLIIANHKQYNWFKIDLMIDYLELMSQGFQFDWTDWCSDAKRIIEFWFAWKAEPTCFVDATDDPGCRGTRRSHSCVMSCYLSTERQILWYSYRQITVEILTFCSEIVALRTAAAMVEDQDTSWACLGLLLMVHVMYFVLTTGFCSQHIQTRKAFWRTSIALTLTTQQENELLLVFWIA